MLINGIKYKAAIFPQISLFIQLNTFKVLAGFILRNMSTHSKIYMEEQKYTTCTVKCVREKKGEHPYLKHTVKSQL